MKKIILTLAFLFTAFITQANATINHSVDGSLTEWGVTPGSNWIPASGIASTVEDYIPGSNSDGYLNPGWGGQKYDAEAMYVDVVGNTLYYAIVTGMPENGYKGTLPGDIAINFNHEGYKYGIAVPDYYTYVDVTSTNGRVVPYTSPGDGDLYKVDSSLPGDGTDNHGWIWSAWPTDMAPMKIEDYGGILPDSNPKTSQWLADGTLQYKNFAGDTSHWIIEGSVPISGFGSDWGKCFEMVWTETCGNDVIRLNYCPIPEPTTLLLFGLGMIGIIGRVRRTKSRS